MVTSGTAAAWLIGVVAAACGVWAIADLVDAARADAPTPAILSEVPAARPGGAAVDLYRLVAEGSENAGTLVRVDGTVVGTPQATGFWVRDLRDNVVYVVSGERPRSGEEVRVLGRLERRGERADAHPAAPPPGTALLLSRVRVVASGPAAVEVLGD